MKFIARIILIGTLSYFAAAFFPWWGIAIIAGVVSFLIPGHGFNVFISGFLGIGLLWMGFAWKIDIETNAIMSSKIIELFPINDITLLVIATGVIGGMVGAFGALTGSSFRHIFMKKRNKSYYN